MTPAATARQMADRMRAAEGRRDELEQVAHEAARLEGRRDAIALELVDEYGWSLRHVATAAGTSPATLLRRLERVRSTQSTERKGA
jgi:CRP-like cAMP-binding protein